MRSISIRPSLISSLAFLALALLGATGCALDGTAVDDAGFVDDDVTGLEEPITLGDPNVEPPWVVDVNGCTGVVLSQHYVLTAAHCFGRSSFFAVTVRTGMFRETVLVTSLTTSQVVIHPDFVAGSSNRAAWDLALVRLGGNGVGATFPRARIYAGPEAPWTKQGNSFYIIGYGKGSNPNGVGDCDRADSGGIKRWAFFATRGSGIQSNGAWQSVNAYHSRRSTCNGDSGAPYLLPRSGQNYVFAIHSGSTGKPGGTVTGAMVRPKMDWILAESSKMGVPLRCAYVRDHTQSPEVHYFDCREG